MCGHRQPLVAEVACTAFGLDPFGMHHSRKMVVAIADVRAGSHVTTDDGIVRCSIVEEVLAAM